MYQQIVQPLNPAQQAQIQKEQNKHIRKSLNDTNNQ